MKKNFKVIIGVVLCVGILFLGISCFSYFSTQRFLKTAKITIGTVVSLRSDFSPSPIKDGNGSTPSISSNTYYYPVVKFIDLNGQNINFESSIGSNPSDYNIGQSVKVAYNFANSKDAQIFDTSSQWGLSIVMGIMGFVFLLVVLLIFVSYKKNKKLAVSFLKSISSGEIPEEGIKVPLLAAFKGFKNIPFIALAYNNSFPKFILYKDKIIFRVITSFTKKYEDISEVGLFRTIGTEIIRISFKDSSLTFDGNLFDEETLSCLISFFKEKGVKLSPEAEEFIKT